MSPGSRSQENGEDEILPDAPAGQEEREGTGVKLEDMFNDDDDGDDPITIHTAHVNTEDEDHFLDGEDDELFADAVEDLNDEAECHSMYRFLD